MGWRASGYSSGANGQKNWHTPEQGPIYCNILFPLALDIIANITDVIFWKKSLFNI